MHIPSELIVLLMAMLPLTELRASIPYGIAVLGMDPWSAFAFSVIGNTIISALIILLLPPITNFTRKHFTLADQLFEALFERTRTKHSKRMAELGYLALVTFVAIPLPGSGGWTGSLIAYVFDINKKLSLPLITIGIMIAGVLVTLATQGVIEIFIV